MYICIKKRTIICIARLIAALLVVAVWRRPVVVPAANYEWGLYYEKANTLPVPNLEDSQLNPYNAYYHGNGNDKIIYLTFDAGYENGNTAPILDALARHNAPAAFFVVGPYIKENPELIKRMVAEGHTVGNHTYHHPDMRNKTQAEFAKELEDTAAIYAEVTGQQMPKFYRPPEGKFSTDNLQWANELGYSTIFWSSAYVDWNVDSQPGHSTAFEKIARRTFPGAVFLLHSTSKTNAEILDEQLARWENEGYTFGSVQQLADSYKQGEI